MSRDFCSITNSLCARFRDVFYATNVGRDTIVYSWGLVAARQGEEPNIGDTQAPGFKVLH